MNRAARRAERFGKRSRHVDPTGGLGCSKTNEPTGRSQTCCRNTSIR